MNIDERIKEIEEEEAILQFDHFSYDDAWDLGNVMVNTAREKKVSVSFEININGFTVFRYAFPGTTLHNEKWMLRKRNMVNTIQKSSIQAGYLLEQAGEKLGENWHLSHMDYADLGGGFPIVIKGTGIIGTACVSGLSHEEDHELIVECIRRYLEKKDENN